MKALLQELKQRNTALYRFGGLCLAAALICVFLIGLTNTQVLGVSAWIKPMKFFLSTTIFAWTMGWIMTYLTTKRTVTIYSWLFILVFLFELSYISIQAAFGKLSHFNTDTQLELTLWGIMGGLIVTLTLATAYICLLFFLNSFPKLPKPYLWGIRLGLFIFVLSAFQGGLMVSALAHTVGAADGGEGLPLVNWSTKHGDLRVAHFFGMHALQIVPLVSFYLLKEVKFVILFSISYLGFITYMLMQALGGMPFLGL